MRRMPRAPLADTLAPLAGLGIETHLGPREGDGWVAADRLAGDAAALRAVLGEVRASLGTDRDDVCAAQLVELWTWLVAAPAAGAIVVGSRLPDVSSANVLLQARGGLADWRAGLRSTRFHALPGDPEAGHRDALAASDERILLSRLRAMLVEDHLAPLVAGLNRIGRRPERALWRGAADRVAGAFLWIGEQLGARRRAEALARGAIGSAPPLGARVRTQRVGNSADETHVHLRAGCCLYYRVPGAPKCIGCPLVTDAERERRVAAAAVS
jgi:FhuF 2Fe-2S C-terminal domain/Ferric iron reductase FhuF-like transporter